MRSSISYIKTYVSSELLHSCGLRHSSYGVDAFRAMLLQHRQDVEADAASRCTESTVADPQRNSGDGKDTMSTPSGDDQYRKPFHDGPNKTTLLIKEMIRIFTRKVPGGLVPDGLVQGFMQAYRELEGPRERLAFFRLVINEMGISVDEINSAVRVWDGLLARSLQGATLASGIRDGDDVASAARPATADRQRQAMLAPVSVAMSNPTPVGFPDATYRAADRLASSCRPLYTQLFLPISQAPNGMKFLVELRETLLELSAEQADPSASAPLRAMADHLRQSLAEWFSVGLLYLQPISWQESPAALLERVMRCEAVHPVASWEQLRQRLGPSRRVFAFTHPSMPGEPLVVLHTALMQRPATSMKEILEEPSAALTPSCLPHHRPLLPTTAVFYSISASQPGLRGIELGHFLIKRVAELLLAENPSIRHLVTLSPLPNFRSWLISRLRQEQAQLPPAPSLDTPQGPIAIASEPPTPSIAPLLRPEEAAGVLHLAQALGWSAPLSAVPQASMSRATEVEATTALLWLLEGDRWLLHSQPPPQGDAATSAIVGEPSWGMGQCGDGGVALQQAAGGPVGSPAGDRSLVGEQGARAEEAGPAGQLESKQWAQLGIPDAVLRPLLLRLAARYLVLEKRRGFALCPVAHFHLRNGACLWRLNWKADTSPLGLQRSLGIMVNYDYHLAAMYDNNRKYLLQHEVHAHPQVMQLL